MNFSYLEEVRQKFDEILVIGRDFEREGKKYHLIGMTVAMEAKLYLIEPLMVEEEDCNLRKGIQNQR